ncbi:hypothetical protein SELR_24800 [Selenomonas ruminantium subsp. lactilytica TAM6421]|uniref:Uncharacterized protein n=1 Tax=Selenomonas ruminantium subsp. lactilytica (strain NBRC 103574 / TAM6421) TaxID=927704 RepID=I0GTV1_SELRL|nr:hypothetical protein [Selenomonas ruminantium]BAL84188.1 hypothetical protein SELR_24800 [Selenomonas ruminantium subsp. lactilytica TAM6421]
MSINTIAATSSLNYWQQQAQAVRPDTAVHSKSHSFEDILALLTAVKATQDSDVESDVATVTLTKLLADGSLVIQRVEGDKIISETRLDGSNNFMQQQIMSQNG